MKRGKKLTKAQADVRDLSILASVAHGNSHASIAAACGVTPSYIRKLLAETRKDAHAPWGRNRDVMAQP